MTDPLWFKDAVIYEVHVRAFRDANGDGRGDFRGLIESLDYLYDLGVTALWLLPFYPSPWRDDGYDISDYRQVHPAYGTLDDFREFLDEAHRRGLRVITELVINHTSDQHPWFQRARRSPPGSAHRAFYVWSDDDRRYSEARIIFKDFELSNWSWDPLAKAYYWHRFYHHQPDLNFDSPDVRRAVLELLDYWLDMGVDGLRLDAVPYLFEREGTSCENLVETHGFLRELRAHIDAKYGDRMLLAEANQWPEDAVAYFGKGDECHMAFHFPVMPRLFMAMHMEDRFPIVDILDQTPAIPPTCQWALFLRNHDELTLEMVTDEERDYMYRTYANDPQARINLGIRRRLAPLLENNRRRIELMNGLLLSLPGTPILYYGDEIGMGDNIYLGDRNGVRTPMQWSADRNAGFGRANPQQLYLPVIIDPEYHYETVNVEAQLANRTSLLWWTRRLIALRRRHRSFGRGTIEFLQPENSKVLAFLRRFEDETILVVANLSRFAQWARLDLASFAGSSPVELMGRTAFPPVGADLYFLTLGPHSFYWLRLETSRATMRLRSAPTVEELPVLAVANDWEAIFTGLERNALEEALPAFLARRRWFARKGGRIKSALIADSIRFPPAGRTTRIALVDVEFLDATGETYLLPLAHAAGEEASAIVREAPLSIVARVRTASGEEGILHDAVHGAVFRDELLSAFHDGRRIRIGTGAALTFVPEAGLGGAAGGRPESRILQADQTNTSVVYGDRFLLKLYRRLESGIQPDAEIGRFLTAAGFPHVPALAGTIEIRSRTGPTTIGLLESFVPNEGDAWRYTLDWLDQYFERVRARSQPGGPPEPPESPLDRMGAAPPEAVLETMGSYVVPARLLAERTADLHRALAGDLEHPDFRPEPLDAMYQRSFYQSIRNQASKTLARLARAGGLDPERSELVAQVLALRDAILGRTRALLERKFTSRRIRIHGDFHLGQVLYTGRDFVIIDFEGEPSRSLGERRLKRSPLRDVAGMMRSFHYAAYASLFRLVERGLVRPEERAVLASWGESWYRWTSAVYLRRYLEAVQSAGILSVDEGENGVLLEALLIEKALYEVVYELDHRPDWVRIPLVGLLGLFDAQPIGNAR